jgi:DNA polymerase III subunit alpha
MLKPTYGIMVYQEQIMQTAQIMADFSLGQADLLRRAMGKKKKEEMEKQSAIFVAGATKKGVTEKNARDIFEIMEKFASYGFNRSHAAAYSVVAFQTAYLKANYAAEYMASVLTHNKDKSDTLNIMLQECKAQGIDVLGPDVNESQLNFTVNSKGQIRFGLSAIKGVGEVPVEKLLETRREGAFATIADFVRRVPPQVANKKCLESFAYSGALDCFGLERVQYFTPTEKEATFVDALNRYNSVFHKQQKDTSASLFGEESLTDLIEDPIAPKISKRWSLIEQLKYEKDVVGIFISGHPLNDYELEYRRFATPIADLHKHKDKDVAIAGIVTAVNHRVNQKGGGYGFLTISDYDDNLELAFFNDNYLKYKDYMQLDMVVFVKGKYLTRFNKPNEFELRVNEMRLLDGMAKEKIRQISLNIAIDQLNKELILQLDEICNRFAGEQLLGIKLSSPKQGITLQYIAFKRKVQIDSLLLRALEKLGIATEIN